MTVRVGALVLYASSIDDTVAFYRAIGIDLEEEDHGDEVRHFAAEVQGCHFAVFAAVATSEAPGLEESGCSFVGVAVDSVHASLDRLRALGAPLLQEPTPYPWGLRAVVADPDGRPVEIFEPPAD